MAIKYIEICAGSADARAPIDRTGQLAAGIYVDSNDGYKLKYIANGVLTQLQDNAGVQQGIETTAVVALTGSVWHTGNGTANVLAWSSPAIATIITRVVIAYTHISTGAATVAAGQASAKGTLADNLIDDLDINGVAAPFTYSNFEKTDTEKTEIWCPASQFVTFTASADPTGFVGNAYIFYYAA
jgi:hypothetical protein